MSRIEARRKNAKALRVKVFEVLGQSPASVEPGEGALDNPTLWENLEAFGVIRPFDDFGFEVRKRFGQSPSGPIGLRCFPYASQSGFLGSTADQIYF